MKTATMGREYTFSITSLKKVKALSARKTRCMATNAYLAFH